MKGESLRIKVPAWLVVGLLALAISGGATQEAPKEVIDRYHGLGYVVVSPQGPDDGSDFGPKTPNTKTAGLQEAFDEAKKKNRDVYIAGPGVYHLKETLKIPWRQNFRLDGGEYVVNYENPTGDAVVIDSQMNCFIKLGLIVSQSPDAVVRMKPETKGPDGFNVIVASDFWFNAFVGGGDVWGRPGAKGKGIGLWMDGTVGPIVHNRIFAIEANACDKGLYMTGRSSNNWIQIPFMHLCNIHIQIGDQSSPNLKGNVIEAYVDGAAVENSVGAQIFGQENILTLNLGRFGSGRGIIFEPPAKDNRITAINPAGRVTNNATTPTNRIDTAQPTGFDLATPAIPASGRVEINRNPFAVEIIVLAPGNVSSWTIADAKGTSQAVPAGLSAGQRFVLNPGEKIRFDYSQPPAWRWRGL